jgi:hypothetical protein
MLRFRHALSNEVLSSKRLTWRPHNSWFSRSCCFRWRVRGQPIRPWWRRLRERFQKPSPLWVTHGHRAFSPVFQLTWRPGRRYFKHHRVFSIQLLASNELLSSCETILLETLLWRDCHCLRIVQRCFPPQAFWGFTLYPPLLPTWTCLGLRKAALP